MSGLVQTYWRSAVAAVVSVAVVLALAGITGLICAGIGATNVFLFRKWVG